MYNAAVETMTQLLAPVHPLPCSLHATNQLTRSKSEEPKVQTLESRARPAPFVRGYTRLKIRVPRCQQGPLTFEGIMAQEMEELPPRLNFLEEG